MSKTACSRFAMLLAAIFQKFIYFEKEAVLESWETKFIERFYSRRENVFARNVRHCIAVEWGGKDGKSEITGHSFQ